ncbi:MAG: hypothetical protein QNK34_05535 [Woeseiaceae bacterium]|nr:hypothetical protein [Woeseiaceae bacterium]
MRLIIIIVVSLAHSVGFACSCIWPNVVTERYVLDRLCAAEAVFVGDVESSLHLNDFTFEYKIWPRESFKGQLKSPAFAISETGGMCGYPFRENGRYLIFANRHDDTEYLSASICGLTRLLDRDDVIYETLEASKGDIEQLCGTEATEARRSERLREKDQTVEKLEEETRKLLNSSD